jgi:hypothetical protein
MSTLFDYPYCTVCGEALAPKEHAGSLLNGFQDADTKQIVHLKSCCRELHYERKPKELGSQQVTYNELPITIEQWLNRNKPKQPTKSNTELR